jgi:hypothetical protein
MVVVMIKKEADMVLLDKIGRERMDHNCTPF